jgi:hypothetical protein
MLLILLRVLALAVGLLLVYVAAFTYESTDRRIHSRLEDLWLTLAYGPHAPAGLTQRLVRVVLRLLDGMFSRVFGPGRVTLRTLSAAACIAYGTLAAFAMPLLMFLALVADVPMDPFLNSLPLTPAGYVMVGIAACAIGTLPAVHASLRWVTYAAAAAIAATIPLGLWAIAAGQVLKSWDTVERTIGAIASSIALPYGIAAIHAIRHGVRKTVAGPVTWRDRIFVGGLLGIAVVTFAGLLAVAVIARGPRGPLTIWLANLLKRPDLASLLFSFGSVLSPWGALLAVGTALLLVVLLHVTMWPAVRILLMKTLYAAHRHELISRKKMLWSVGVALVASAIAPPNELVMKIIGAVR